MDSVTQIRFRRLIESYEQFITTRNREALVRARYNLEMIQQEEALTGFFAQDDTLPLPLQFYEDVIREDLPPAETGRASSAQEHRLSE